MTKYMPKSIDYTTQASQLERRLRALKKNISGVGEAAKSALESDDEVIPFEVQLAEAEESWKEFLVCWDERDALHDVIPEDTFPTQQWEQSYEALRLEMREAKVALLRIKRRTKPTPELDLSVLVNSLSASGAGRSNLPKISLPHFSGTDLLKWTHFKDSFQSMIHHQTSLSDIEKFHHLLGAVSGEAALHIKGFPVEERSYQQAWNKLVKIYDNPRVLANLFVQRILDCNVTAIKTEEQRYTTFLSAVADSIEGFRRLNLENPTEVLLSALALRTLDPESRKHFELSRLSTTSFPTADEVINFITNRLSALKLSRDPDRHSQASSNVKNDSSQGKFRSFPNRNSSRYNAVSYQTSCSDLKSPCPSHPKSRNISKPGQQRHQRPQRAEVQTEAGEQRQVTSRTCPFCQGNHLLPYCVQFLEIGSDKRQAFIRGWKGCSNCLREDHNTVNCKSKWSCRYCRQKHHSLVHQEHPNKNLNKNPDNAPAFSGQIETFNGFGSSRANQSHGAVLLGTIQAFIIGHHKGLFPVRAVLDSGSQNTFITSALARKTGCDIKQCKAHITGLGGSAVTQPKGYTEIVLRPFESDKEFKTEAVVVDCISPPLPITAVRTDVVEKLSSLRLADNHYDTPGPIDLLIGVDVYPQIVNGAPQPSDMVGLFLLPTVFGLVVMGKVTGHFYENSNLTFLTTTQAEIESQLKAFWEIEEIPPTKRQSPEDQFCEDHFQNTHSRDSEGRYIVELPLKSDIGPIGTNRDVVTRRFYSLESKFKNDANLSCKYKEFMEDYINQQHMSLAKSPSPYLIPHHGIWQQRPEGPKLRVVFDASCPSTSVSLNELLLPGPKLQADLSQILINFRRYKIPLCADLVQMYRQILVHGSHRHLQHILWRANQSEELKEYELNTVTYGVRPSAFLALRVLKQLVIDEGSSFPLASKCISTSAYVDDIAGGADSEEEAFELQRQLIKLFSKGGFRLSKWASTLPALASGIVEQVKPVHITDHDKEHLKILGLVWKPTQDSFSYHVQQPPTSGVTKRAVLSCIARIFDPLGMLAPVIFQAKTILQEIWKIHLDWDNPLPPRLLNHWKSIVDEWDLLSSVAIPRYFGNSSFSAHIIGFCDASDKGYAAVIYLRIQDPEGGVKISLVKAKTKVAPLKFISIARLELCGALLLARLLTSVNIPSMTRHSPICFTDSTVVLSWLNKATHMLKTFEANRVEEILNTADISCWNHVSSEENPADIASRGCGPRSLKENNLWWNGPSWLLKPHWEESVLGNSPANCLLSKNVAITQNQENLADDWMSRFSSFTTLIRIVARILRLSNRGKPKDCPITAEEFQEAKIRCVILVQRQHLPMELTSGKCIPKEYSKLTPFLDERGIVRVGGRLHEAPLPASSRHPALLPRNCQFTRILIDEIHQRHYHAGPTLTQALIRCEFWIPSSLRYIRGRILRCVPCRIMKTKPTNPLMAPLPKDRFSQARAFLQVGVDYAGPFLIKESQRRTASLGKAYLCIFVCMATKAVHLEAVSSLTTVAFLAALDRFIARRGLPKAIHSDHGSNFIGASRFLKDVYKFLAQKCDVILEHLAPRKVDWKFIPPHSPHFGGLWEAGVKSVKALLIGSVGKQPFTFEELGTIFIKIEGCLNSRPLCPLTEDTECYDFLTPGHFLIGGPLSCAPEATEEATLASTTRWRAVQRQFSLLWDRWRKEYLHYLMQRNKWHQSQPGLRIGDLVIMVEKRSLVGHWPVARVIQAHPGKDKVVRVVTVRTPNGSNFVRSVHTLIPLFHPEHKE